MQYITTNERGQNSPQMCLKQYENAVKKVNIWHFEVKWGLQSMQTTKTFSVILLQTQVFSHSPQTCSQVNDMLYSILNVIVVSVSSTILHTALLIQSSATLSDRATYLCIYRQYNKKIGHISQDKNEIIHSNMTYVRITFKKITKYITKYYIKIQNMQFVYFCDLR